MANRIHSKGPSQHEEYVAGAAGIYPGYLLLLNSANQVVNHNVEGGVAEALFAEEDALQGHTVSTVYTSGAVVSCILPGKGSVVTVSYTHLTLPTTPYV